MTQSPEDAAPSDAVGAQIDTVDKDAPCACQQKCPHCGQPVPPVVWYVPYPVYPVYPTYPQPPWQYQWTPYIYRNY
jgi:hypothetical protein